MEWVWPGVWFRFWFQTCIDKGTAATLVLALETLTTSLNGLHLEFSRQEEAHQSSVPEEQVRPNPRPFSRHARDVLNRTCITLGVSNLVLLIGLQVPLVQLDAGGPQLRSQHQSA